MAAHADALRRLQAAVWVVSFGTPMQVAAWARRLALPFPVAADPTRATYRAFGLGRGSSWQVWHPRTMWRYLRLLGGGARLHRPVAGDDLHQLGGDVVLDAAGVIRLLHRSERPDDRPPAARLLAALAAAP